MTKKKILIAISSLGKKKSYKPVFADNTWEDIAYAFKNDEAPETWQLGDTKSVLIDNQTYTARICDMKKGRYAYSDGSGNSNCVIELVQLQAAAVQMSTLNVNNGGWANCAVKTSEMVTLFNKLPQDLRNVIPQIKVLSGTGNSTTSGTSSSDNKIFLPAETEIFSTTTSSIGVSETANGGQEFGQYQLYAANNTDAFRKKTRLNGVGVKWWLRSPQSNSNNRFCCCDFYGRTDKTTADSWCGISITFAF